MLIQVCWSKTLVSLPLVIHDFILFHLPHSGTNIQCSICVFALCWVSLCGILCVIHLALSSHSLALFLCLCVFSPYEASYDQRGICQPHTQTRSQAKHNGTRRRAGTYTIVTREVSMVASAGSPLQLLPVLVHCRYDCLSSNLFLFLVIFYSLWGVWAQHV